MSAKQCPYPGLRPFTVEESIFFKGRDLHIRQIISKLEEKKILILTGASGDGKSSLVYAGVIPNARAGFFRAKYNNWLFSTFRPERNPLKNLAQCVAENLQIDADYCEKELSYGFSALIDLYKASPFYIDETQDKWLNLSDSEKKQRKQKAANLFILADQFEEFFTNSENFNHGKPTGNAYTTVNLLLETARIALRDNLPVYVICTMRSDFISQSVAFRGLPETIGFSQFFVPRLNRNELQQVIEEPAILSGGKLSKRLKEILINELHDGFDQLPLLQHTLKQLWEIADNGNEEIDLLHLAKIGGLNRRVLPAESKENFELWYQNSDNSVKKYLENPSANNVLNAHANFLYDTAFAYFNDHANWAEKNITLDDSKLIIKIAFQSLVKIDEGRAVRSRQTLREITDIINLPHIKYETVCGILNVFRLPGNTFLYPFIIPNQIETEYLSAETVLDITHEALIRNWVFLKQWNDEEYDNLNTFNDFNIQLQRWLGSQKSEGFLLALGPLSHFEAWYERCKPNKYWLAKYDTSTQNYDEKLSAAEQLAFDIEAFISESRKYIIAIERVKRRRRTIIMIAATVVILILSGFTYWAMSEKKVATKQKLLAEEQTEVAKHQQQLALAANKTAEEQRIIAVQNEQQALFAKAQSDSARSLAEQMRLIADDKTILAKTEAEKALAEKKAADEQRKIAEQQKKIALAASDSAKTLSYLAISQSLCFKATQKFDDSQLNLLLALQAYRFNSNYGGYSRDAVLFNALKYTQTIANPKNGIAVSPNLIGSAYVSGNNLWALCKNAEIIQYTISTKKINSKKPIKEITIPVKYAFFISESELVFQLEDKNLFYFNILSGKLMLLKGHTDFIRFAARDKNNEFIVTGGRDMTVRIWKTSIGENFQTIKLNDRINAGVLSANNTDLFVGLNNGEVIKIDVSTLKQTKVSAKNSPVFALCEYPDQSFLAAGYADGELRLFDSNNNFKAKNLNVSGSGVRFISVNAGSELLAICTDDKVIKIFDLKNLDKNPSVISDFNQKILHFRFDGSKLTALAADNLVYIWETNPEVYAKLIQNTLTRNFTADEWKLFVGEKIPYEKTK